MSHIHDLIDFAVAVYIVNGEKVLLVYHKKLQAWFPVGGHIELDENPEEALAREVREECGLTVRVVGSKPQNLSTEAESLYPPRYLDIARYDDKHKHINLIYFAISEDTEIKLQQNELKEFRWFSGEELNISNFRIREDIKFYAKEALNVIK
jgi:8-oxo-dGTP pyrophosphatase MutT (NUDIX family)